MNTTARLRTETHSLHLGELGVNLLIKLVNLGLLPLHEGVVAGHLSLGLGDECVVLHHGCVVLLHSCLQALEASGHVGDLELGLCRFIVHCGQHYVLGGGGGGGGCAVRVCSTLT